MAIIFIKLVRQLVSALGAIASALLIFLVVLMCYNVIARYAFNASSIGLEELTWHAYAAVFLLGIPYALQSGAHVRVDLLFEKMSIRNQQRVDLVGTAQRHSGPRSARGYSQRFLGQVSIRTNGKNLPGARDDHWLHY
jgi:TRAP-type mannitol/chloroaromatic compound transport system permease small subunit